MTEDYDELVKEAEELSKWVRTERAVIFLFGRAIERDPSLAENIEIHFRKGKTSPDAVMVVQTEKKEKQLFNVEFEFFSKNFLKHDHPDSPNLMIVCYRHNWKECRYPVFEIESGEVKLPRTEKDRSIPKGV